MDFSLSPEQLDIRERARRFVREECDPIEADWPLSDYDADPALVAPERRLGPPGRSGRYRPDPAESVPDGGGTGGTGGTGYQPLVGGRVRGAGPGWSDEG